MAKVTEFIKTYRADFNVGDLVKVELIDMKPFVAIVVGNLPYEDGEDKRDVVDLSDGKLYECVGNKYITRYRGEISLSNND